VKTTALPLALTFCLALASICPAADELPASWTALPEETTLMLRLPNGQAFIDALRSQTKLGAVLLSHDRIERVLELVREQIAQDWDELRKGLGRFDLKPEDWQSLFHNDAGVALTLEPRKGRAPVVVLLGWLEPGEDLSQRLLTAVQTLLAELADGTADAPKRKDLELAGRDVMHIEIPIRDEVTPQLPEVDDGEASEAQLQQDADKFQERLNNAKQVDIDRIHVFVARLGGRLLWASTVPQSSGETKKKNDSEREAIDWDALTGLEEATQVFGRFLSAHDGSPIEGPRRLLETPGLEAALPGGVPLVELLGDPRPLMKLADLADDPAKVKQMLELLGAGGVGPLALRATLDGGALREGLFLSLPAPRTGLPALVDQPPLAPEPPAWVPASAISYQQFSFELGKAYSRLKELAVAQSGDAGRQSFDQIETAAKTFLQIDLPTLLSSLGEQFAAVSFAPRFKEPAKNDDDAKPAAPEVVQRMGLVCKIDNEQIWKQLLQVAARFAKGGAAGGLKMVEEQGFSGCRIERGDNQVGIFIGNGYLAVGVGPEVSESLLSVLVTPPVGDKAMRSNGLVERGRALVAPQPCLLYELTDAGANAKVTRRAIESLIESLLLTNVGAAPLAHVGPSLQFSLKSSVPGDRKALLDKIKAILPSDDELSGMLGVSISQTVVTDDGMVMQSASELPPP